MKLKKLKKAIRAIYRTVRARTGSRAVAAVVLREVPDSRVPFVSLALEPRDLWVGLYWTKTQGPGDVALYLCPVPGVVLRVDVCTADMGDDPVTDYSGSDAAQWLDAIGSEFVDELDTWIQTFMSDLTTAEQLLVDGSLNETIRFVTGQLNPKDVN